MKVVSLFSGAGGIDLGLKQAGLDILWAVDNDLDSIKTYRKNIGDHAVLSDIREIKSEDIPDADLIVGGFPCQGFSQANRFRSIDDNRNTLYIEMLRIVRDKKPKWFVAENVKGILSLDKGRVFESIIKDFSEIGYRLKHELVNMADHGVPQARKRVIILGTRKDLVSGQEAYHPSKTHDKNTWVSITQALSEIEKYKGKFPNNTGSKYKVEFRNFTGHRITDPNKPSPTILARGNGKGGVCAIPHPNRERRLTIRESASVQTFPTDFEFIGATNSMYRQIGNAIPVLYGRKLGEMFLKINDIKQ
ncbi:MAG: DNA cytosine methyltransferase [Alphaproteobacteria bacterium]